MVYRKPGLQTPLSLSPSVASSTSRFCNSGLELVGELSFCLPPWIHGRSTSRSVQSLAESFSSSSVSSVPLISASTKRVSFSLNSQANNILEGGLLTERHRPCHGMCGHSIDEHKDCAGVVARLF